MTPERWVCRLAVELKSRGIVDTDKQALSQAMRMSQYYRHPEISFDQIVTKLVNQAPLAEPQAH